MGWICGKFLNIMLYGVLDGNFLNIIPDRGVIRKLSV
jgi:hypothetical protein